MSKVRYGGASGDRDGYKGDVVSDSETEMRIAMRECDQFLEECGVELNYVLDWGIHWWASKKFQETLRDEDKNRITKTLRKMQAKFLSEPRYGMSGRSS